MPKPITADRSADARQFFDALFSVHHAAVLRYCVRRLGRFEAEDAAADVFAVAWRRLDDVPRGDSQKAWLIGVAHKVVANRFRARGRRARLSERLISEQLSESHPTSSVTSDAGHRVHRALDELSRTDRELIRLSSWDELTRIEIAYVLGIRVNAVDQRLHRARARLKARLDRVSLPTRQMQSEETPQ